MSDVQRVERRIGEKILSIETGNIAKQADGAVLVRYGDTVVLVAAVTAPPRSESIDFFPLSVEYREKTSAAGKFPGGFIKREGRPTTKETLTARMIDRPIRPLFPEGYIQEVQVTANVLSADRENDPDILAIIGASAALTISRIPFMGPLGACRLGRIGGRFVVNPTHSQLDQSDLNLIVGGHAEAINMLEAGAAELSEQVIAEAVSEAHKYVVQVCEMIDELRMRVGVEKETPLVETDERLCSEIRSEIAEKMYEIKLVRSKKDRQAGMKELFEQLRQRYLTEGEVEQQAAAEPAAPDEAMIKRIFERIEGETVRRIVLEGNRCDGRSQDQLREISCQVAVLPRTHGSAVFTRGETQSLVTVTLGTIRDAQIIDGLLDEYAQNFTLHYNFPPFSVGEVRPMRGPGRREIGHGALAEKALLWVKPRDEDFAYTVRVVSDITESNGSSSMASVCGGSLALMDAGVPITSAVAGISIGMVTDEQGKDHLLTDIIGEEDHFGEMDFKIAGTRKGITAIQLDIKAHGLSHETMVRAMEQARKARLAILDTMDGTISRPRPQLSEYAPKLISIEIDPEYIGKIIGPGGKMIKSIQEQTDTTIEIEEDGTVYISSLGGDGHLKAREIIESMTQPPKVGRIYLESRVVSVKDFGVFVEITPGVEGLCHVSELAQGYTKNVSDICKVGDVIPVKLLAMDEQGKLRLSRRAALNELDKKKDAQSAGRKE